MGTDLEGENKLFEMYYKKTHIHFFFGNKYVKNKFMYVIKIVEIPVRFYKSTIFR